MFCARSRPTNKGNREQKPITKKLAEFHNQFVLLTMFSGTRNTVSNITVREHVFAKVAALEQIVYKNEEKLDSLAEQVSIWK